MGRNGVVLKGVRKIAVLRANGLGDFLFALPALHALRAAYSGAEIVLLGLPWHKTFLRDRPSPVDRVVVVPPVKGIREEAGLEEDGAETNAFLDAMRRERFDLAVQMHGGGHYSNPFLLAMNAGMAAGLKADDAVPLDLWVPYVYFQPEVLRYLEIVGLLGAEPVGLEPRVDVTGRDVEESAAIVGNTDQPLVAMVPGGGDGRRRWPPEKFARIADLLSDAGGRVLIPGIGPERPIVGRIVELMKRRADNLCGQLSINGLTGLLSRCTVVIGNDSGPLHLAKAVGIPTVGVYWCGNLITAEPITRRYHRPLLSWRLDCPVCGANCIYSKCDHHDSFVADVSVEEVYRQTMSLVDGSLRGTRPP